MDTPTGSEVVFAAHLPLLQIDADSLAFGGGDLWRMPFETFNVLTARAFEDHRARYEAVAPVFYRFVARAGLVATVPLPADADESSFLQIKLPNNRWSLLPQLGLGFMHRFHALAADPAWQALLLEAPAAAFPQPRWSTSFAIADPGWGFALAEGASRVASVRGDADAEYLLTPSFRAVRLERDALARATAWINRLDDETLAPPLMAAVQALAQASSPLLTPADQLTLATVALESLLLPEVRSGLARRLADRLAALLGDAEPQRQALRRTARTLYDTRSASLHGAELPAQAEAAVASRLGARLLAQAIQALQLRIEASGESLDAVLAALDAGVAPGATPWSTPPRAEIAATRQALHDTRLTSVSMVGSNLEAPAGQVLMWAPLVGLQCHEQFAFADAPAPVATPLTGHELLQLEDRDVARDTDGRVRLLEERIAAIALLLPAAQAADETEGLRLLERQRDLAVVALRLAGFHSFHDPALSGSVMVRGAQRFRRASVLRQSLWQMLLNIDEHPVLAAHDVARIAPCWRLLRAYDAGGGHADIERALSLYRRSFDRRFAPAEAIAALQFSLLETLLGRFRAPGDVPQLEDLVQRLRGPGDAAAAWFAAQGRSTRNAVAHGRAAAVDADAQALLDAINGAALARCIGLRLADPAAPERPATRLIAHLGGELKTDGDT